MSSSPLVEDSFRETWGLPRGCLSAVVELASGEHVGQLLELTASPKQRTSDVVARLLDRRDIRVSAPLLIGLPNDEDLAVRELRRSAAAFRRRGMRLGFSVVVDVRCATRELLESARRLGIRTVLAGDGGALLSWASEETLDRLVLAPRSSGLAAAEPHERASFLAVCRAARENGHGVWARNVDTIADLVMCHRVSASWVSGKTVGGVSGEPVRRQAFGRALLGLAERAANRGLDGAAILEADERFAADLAASVAADPAVNDLASLVEDIAAPLASAKQLATNAALLEARASAMMVIADRELSRLLERVAAGDPPRSERFDRCEQSYEEARALELRASESAIFSQHRAALARASLELRKQVLCGALEARAARLARPRGWARRFLVSAA